MSAIPGIQSQSGRSANGQLRTLRSIRRNGRVGSAGEALAAENWLASGPNDRTNSSVGLSSTTLPVNVLRPMYWFVAGRSTTARSPVERNGHPMQDWPASLLTPPHRHCRPGQRFPAPCSPSTPAPRGSGGSDRRVTAQTRIPRAVKRGSTWGGDRVGVKSYAPARERKRREGERCHSGTNGMRAGKQNF